MSSQNPSSTPTNSQGPQWSEFIALNNPCLLESQEGNNFQSKDFIQSFRSFHDLDLYLIENLELFENEDLGVSFLKTYETDVYINLYKSMEKKEKHLEIDKITKQEAFSIKQDKKEEFIKAVKKCQEYIKEGDIYQANIAQKFQVSGHESLNKDELKSFVYQRLRELNPAEYQAYAEFEDWLVFSSSPESLLKINPEKAGFKLTSSPIKGTVFLNQSTEELKNEKETAEHIMIVDLIRNDLSQVAQKGTVNVEDILIEKSYVNLKHLVSNISCILKKDITKEFGKIISPDFKAILKAIFPGGSITGTPKIRAMQVIHELENKPRELFCGSLGYYKFNQQIGEINILIRSIFYNKKTKELSFSTGAGITALSEPEAEYQETLLKAQKLFSVFNGEVFSDDN